MGRREYHQRDVCAEDGCRETRWYVHRTRAELAASEQRQREHPYRCSRHHNPHEVLRPDNTAVTATFVNGPAEGFVPEALFWLDEITGRRCSGFTYGAGFRAHADDFPPGTRLTVTAYVETPEVQALMAEEETGA